MFNDLQFSASLGSDNHAGVHPRVLEAIVACNRGHAHAYGLDEVSELTLHEFKRCFGDQIQPEYVFTGTAANVLSLSTGLQSFEAYVCSNQAHLHLDECAAPEKFLGSKGYLIESVDGKFSPSQIRPLLERRGDQHYAQPKMISLTVPTELGTVYSLEELRSLRDFAQQTGLYIHVDGARLANACVHLKIDFKTFVNEARPDVISLGGTKNGLMGAEAILLFNEKLKSHFKFHRKQAMQLSSKTRFMAAQFYAYLKEDLWKEIATHVTSEAQYLEQKLKAQHPEIEIVFPIQSNALFVKIPAPMIKPLRSRYFFYIWNQQDHLCRWMISFDWTRQNSIELLRAIQEVKNNVL